MGGRETWDILPVLTATYYVGDKDSQWKSTVVKSLVSCYIVGV